MSYAASAQVKASLIRALGEWVEANCEESWWPEAVDWWPDGIEERMAEAALCVIQGSVMGQAKVREEEPQDE